jgi:hypothetical protein
MSKRLAILLAAAAASVACSGRQTAEDLTTLPQGLTVRQTIPQHLARGHSWMLPESKGAELVYVSLQGAYGKQGVDVYSYPEGKQVGFLQPDSEETYEGLCADAHGNVWVVGWISNGQDFFDEYAHGGTQPINGLSGSGVPSGCSVDPSTGNVAIAAFDDYSVRQGDLAVYQKGQGQPTDYYDGSITNYYFCAYDDKGNLYADGNADYINELPGKSSTLRHVYLSKKIVPGSLQWNAGKLTVTVVGGAKGPVHVDRVTIEGSGAQIAGTSSLKTYDDKGQYLDVEFWIQGKTIAGTGPTGAGPTKALYFWPYPTGGKAIKTIPAPNNGNFYGVALSL